VVSKRSMLNVEDDESKSDQINNQSLFS
jgi:hypothetical protein